MTRLPQLLPLILRRMRQFAAARGVRSGDPTIEKPKDVIASVCRRFANEFRAEGFSYHARSRTLERVRGDLSFRIQFATSWKNLSGVRAFLVIYASVHSRKLEEWRRADPVLRPILLDDPKRFILDVSDDLVLWGQIGNLLARPRWMRWNFAYSGTREEEFADAVLQIRRTALPLFDLFDDPAAALRHLARRRVVWDERAFQYALAELGPAEAEEIGRWYLRRNRLVRRAYLAETRRLATGEAPKLSLDVGANMAIIANAAGLSLSGNGV